MVWKCCWEISNDICFYLCGIWLVTAHIFHFSHKGSHTSFSFANRLSQWVIFPQHCSLWIKLQLEVSPSTPVLIRNKHRSRRCPKERKSQKHSKSAVMYCKIWSSYEMLLCATVSYFRPYWNNFHHDFIHNLVTSHMIRESTVATFLFFFFRLLYTQ